MSRRCSRTSVLATLATLAAGVEELVTVMAEGGPSSIRSALAVAHKHSLIELDDRLARFLAEDPLDPVEYTDELDQGIAAYLECNVAELKGYASYIGNESPYSTQQGVKGAEYPDVLVVLDDDEGRHFQFSYNKYFGVKELSKAESGRSAEGETSIDRTRRLLYVCASRATRALAIAWYTADVDGAVDVLNKSPLTAAQRVVTSEMLSQVVV